MLSILVILVFAGAGLAALAVIVASVGNHWEQAKLIMRDAREVSEVRTFTVRFLTPAEDQPALAPLRRQPRRSVSRPVIRPVGGGQRAAA